MIRRGGVSSPSWASATLGRVALLEAVVEVGASGWRQLLVLFSEAFAFRVVGFVAVTARAFATLATLATLALATPFDTKVAFAIALQAYVGDVVGVVGELAVVPIGALALPSPVATDRLHACPDIGSVEFGVALGASNL